MSWQCGCGVTNRDYRIKCSACGTPKGIVWSPEDFKKLPPRYFGGIIWIIFWTSLVIAPRSIVVVPFALLLAIAAALRQPWGWYVLLIVNLLGFISFSALGVYVSFYQLFYQVMGPTWAFLAFAAVLHALWFVYFYRRRAMFGAKGRWRWYEHTFPKLVGPEEHTPRPQVEPTGP